MTSVLIPAARVRPWLANFARRHGPTSSLATAEGLVVTAEDGAEARLGAHWGPWRSETDPVEDFVAYVDAERTFGVVLARKKAHSVGIVTGQTLTSSRTDSHYVQGRTKAGGWSQQRYARRRGNQATKAFADAADDVVEVLLPAASGLDFLITGGEATAIDAIFADTRLSPLASVARRSPDKIWPTPDPKRDVLIATIEQFQSVEIHLNELA